VNIGDGEYVTIDYTKEPTQSFEPDRGVDP